VAVWDFDGRLRGKEFVERLPFVRAASYFHKPPHPRKVPEFQQSYRTGTASVFPGLFGFDYYLACNGALRNGRTVEEAFGVTANWYLDLKRTTQEVWAEQQFVRTYGRYVVCHFSDFGIFKPWVAAWDAAACAAFCRAVHKQTGATMLLTGCTWDQAFSQQVALKAGVAVRNLCGKTSPDTFFGMLRGAVGVAGWCGGNTILATALRKPTLIAWSIREFPNEAFFHTACPPDAVGRHYVPVVVERETPGSAAAKFGALLSVTAEVAA
jgi:hypothetical protein